MGALREACVGMAMIALVACGDGAGDEGSGDTGAGATGAGAAGAGVSGTGAGGSSAGGSGPGGAGQVLFAEDFESGSLDAWDMQGGNPDKYRITSDPALVHAVSGALEITVQSAWSDGQLNKWFTAVDEIHVAMHIMFAAGWNQDGVSSRHLLQLSGNHVDVMQWGPFPDSSFGQAGVTPDGGDFFWIHLTPWNDDAWHLGMAHPDQASMWGDSLMSSSYTTPGSYQHVVLHAKLNAPGASDGFVRLLVDGAVAIERTAITWRTSDALVFNSTGFQAYYNDFAGISQVYVDDLVVREGPP